MEINSVDAALSGLKLFRRQPAVYGWWLVFNLVFVSLILAVLYFLFATWIQQIVNTAVADGQPSVSMILSILPRIGLSLLILIPLALIYISIRNGAATRAILTPEDSRFGYLRFGADEGRLILVNLVLFLIRLGVQLVFGLVLGIVFGVAVASHRGGGLGGMMAVQLTQQIMQLPLYAVAAFLFIKFALAFPLTVDRKRVEIFSAWTMSNGRFVSMFVAYLIAFGIWIGVTIVLGIIALMIMLGAAGAFIAGVGSTLQSNPAEGMRQLMNFLPVVIGTIALLSALFAPIATALFYCPGAKIYQAIEGRTEDVF